MTKYLVLHKRHQNFHQYKQLYIKNPTWISKWYQNVIVYRWYTILDGIVEYSAGSSTDLN